MVARADRAELGRGHWASLRWGLKSVVADLVEHRMVGALLRRHAHAERDPARDLAHDRLDAAERVEVGLRQLRLHGLVAAADVVADTRGRDVALVGDAAADRLAVARVMVGAEDAERGVARLHAALSWRGCGRRPSPNVVIVLIGCSFLSMLVVWWKTPGGVEPPLRALQARASPLGHGVGGSSRSGLK